MHHWKKLLRKVRAEHISAVLDEFDDVTRTVPPQPRARLWFVKRNTFPNPSKYVLARAVKIATGHDFPPEARSGGRPTVDVLRKILGKGSRVKVFGGAVGNRRKFNPIRHSHQDHLLRHCGIRLGANRAGQVAFSLRLYGIGSGQGMETGKSIGSWKSIIIRNIKFSLSSSPP
jgi:hypothetical protein